MNPAVPLLALVAGGCTLTIPVTIPTSTLKAEKPASPPEQVPDERQGVICYRDRDSGSISCVQIRDSKQPP